MMIKKRGLLGVGVAFAFFYPMVLAQAQTIKIATLAELSGSGASAGTNFKNGVELAVKEINAAGGILGKKLENSVSDTQTNPGVAKGLAQKAVDAGVVAVFGPVFSGSIMVSMNETKRAEIPNFVAGEATGITQQGNPFVFRTSFTQSTAMPKVARYIQGDLRAKSVTVMYVNNDFGKGGRDAIVRSLEGRRLTVAADISTEPGQIDFSASVLKAKQANADVLFVYLNEEESARLLRELRKQGWDKPIIGESTLTGQKVIDLAGEAANGALAHVGLTVDAPVPAMLAFRAKFEKEYKYVSDHNGIKGYTGVYIMKAAIEKSGKADALSIAKTMKGITISAAQYPNIIMDVTYDDKGDLVRDSFLVEVKNGKQEVKTVLPVIKLN
jgi:branched-chain amino acid transport system substrate-binding protein